MFVTELGTFTSGAITYIDGGSYRCWSRLGAGASFTKLKPLSKPGCILLIQELCLKKLFFYVKSEVKTQMEINLVLSKGVFEV